MSTEMQKVADAADIYVLFFSAGANFWAILGHFWAIFGNFGPFLGQFGQFFGIFRLFWLILGHFWAIFWCLFFVAKYASVLFKSLFATLLAPRLDGRFSPKKNWTLTFL